MRTSVPVAGLGALLLAAGAVGCGGAKPAEKPVAMTPAAAVARAAKNTEDITSFEYRMTGTVPEAGKVSGEASMRLKPTVAMSMKMEASGSPAGDGEMEIRLVDKAMYIGGGAEMAKEMDGKSWMKFDLSGTGADKELAELGSPGQAEQNPAAESTFLTGAKDVKKVGTEEVDGVRTTHYKGTVGLADLRDSLKGSDAETRKQREKSIEQYEDLGVDKLAMDIWIDGDDRTKRFRTRGDTDKGPLDTTITFLGFNEPVRVTAPPAGDVVDLAEMLGELGES